MNTVQFQWLVAHEPNLNNTIQELTVQSASYGPNITMQVFSDYIYQWLENWSQSSVRLTNTIFCIIFGLHPKMLFLTYSDHGSNVIKDRECLSKIDQFLYMWHCLKVDWCIVQGLPGSLPNADQYGSLPINSDQFLSIGFERNWSALIGIDRQWSVIRINDRIMIGIDRHWLRESCILHVLLLQSASKWILNNWTFYHNTSCLYDISILMPYMLKSFDMLIWFHNRQRGNSYSAQFIMQQMCVYSSPGLFLWFISCDTRSSSCNTALYWLSTQHSTKEIIVIMWTCHLKRHTMDIPHSSNSFTVSTERKYTHAAKPSTQNQGRLEEKQFAPTQWWVWGTYYFSSSPPQFWVLGFTKVYTFLWGRLYVNVHSTL